jgi:hypothetical protein
MEERKQETLGEEAQRLAQEDESRYADEPEPCQPPEEPPTGSRYKRGRRWWEQSKWERRR